MVANLLSKRRRRMEKILSMFLIISVILLAGCEVEKEVDKKSASNISILQSENISTIQLYFHTKGIDITDKQDIQSIQNMFANNKLERNTNMDGSKGWIYKVVTNNSKKDILDTIFIIDETNIKLKNKVYTCEKKIDLSKLDEISGFNREEY